MIIEIHDREFAESEALQTALVRTLWHQNVRKVDIFVSPRVPEDAPYSNHPGWLEYGIKYEYETGGQMFVGMIQRKRGADYEFHSLIAEYEDEIRSWDWKMIIKWFDNHCDSPDYYEDDGDENRFVYQWIGIVFGLTPSGKVYASWTTNQADEDVIRDEAWWEALEVVASEHNCFVGSPDGCGGDDIFLCKRFDTPEEDDEDDDSFS